MNSLNRGPNHQFSLVPSAQIQRSRFDRSHGMKTTFQEGYLIPVYVDEVLPGDTFSLKMNVFARMATPIYPIMDNLFLESFFFFVPNRLIWEHWENFNGAQIPNPGSSTSYTVPVINITSGVVCQSIFDYMGWPQTGTISVSNITGNALHLRAYNLIWNEWFRDQNLQDEVTVEVDDGPDNPAQYVLLQRGKRHDYFTACLPWPQKGTAVTLPLGNYAPVYPYSPDASSPGWTAGGGYAAIVGNFMSATGNTGVPVFDPLWANGSTGSHQAVYGSSGSTQYQQNFFMHPTKPGISSGTAGDWGAQTNQGYLAADLSAATAATINQIRQAFQIQRMYERDARGGTRYTEIIRSHFGVVSPDARLQRPEFLGGGRSNVNISTLPQTSASGISGSAPLGTLGGIGTASGGHHGFTKSFTEHGCLVGLVCVRADINYQQGLNRMWSRQTRLDYFWPALAHLGEQAVLNQEIFYANNTGGGATQNQAVFGYQERYGEYRYKPSLITGAFNSNFTTPLDSWHLAQYFSTLPALNSSFIVEAAPMSRVEAVNVDDEDFIMDAWFQLMCARPMPVYGVPGDIDRF